MYVCICLQISMQCQRLNISILLSINIDSQLSIWKQKNP